MGYDKKKIKDMFDSTDINIVILADIILRENIHRYLAIEINNLRYFINQKRIKEPNPRLYMIYYDLYYFLIEKFNNYEDRYKIKR